MTDRVQNLTVVLDGDYRTDDVQIIMDAIQMIKGVAKVTMGEPTHPQDYFARQHVAMEMHDKILALFKDMRG